MHGGLTTALLLQLAASLCSCKNFLSLLLTDSTEHVRVAHKVQGKLTFGACRPIGMIADPVPDITTHLWMARVFAIGR